MRKLTMAFTILGGICDGMLCYRFSTSTFYALLKYVEVVVLMYHLYL